MAAPPYNHAEQTFLKAFLMIDNAGIGPVGFDDNQ